MFRKIIETYWELTVGKNLQLSLHFSLKQISNKFRLRFSQPCLGSSSDAFSQWNSCGQFVSASIVSRFYKLVFISFPFVFQVIVRHLSKFITNRIDADLEKRTLFISLTVPMVKIRGNYRVNGNVFVFQISGNGPFQVSFLLFLEFSRHDS